MAKEKTWASGEATQKSWGKFREKIDKEYGGDAKKYYEKEKGIKYWSSDFLKVSNWRKYMKGKGARFSFFEINALVKQLEEKILPDLASQLKDKSRRQRVKIIEEYFLSSAEMEKAIADGVEKDGARIMKDLAKRQRAEERVRKAQDQLKKMQEKVDKAKKAVA